MIIVEKSRISVKYEETVRVSIMEWKIMKYIQTFQEEAKITDLDLFSDIVV